MPYPPPRARRALIQFPAMLVEGVWRFAGALLCLLAIAGAGRAEAGTTPELQLQMTTPSSLDTGTFGSNGAEAIGVSFALLNAADLADLTAQAPFTIRTQLPAGVTYAGMNAPTGTWSCISTPPMVECTYAHDLTYWNYAASGLAIWIDTAQNIPVPGSSDIRVTLESAEVPLPSPLVCEDVPNFNIATSDTGCVERELQHRQSELHIVQAFWSHWTPELTAGGTGSLQIGFESIGYSQNNGEVTVQVLLPPGITRYGGGGSPVFDCVDGTPDAQGQLVTCTTAYLYDGQNQQTASLNFYVDVADDVDIPGPLPVYATIFNDIQPARAFALCDDTPMIFGCGYYNAIMTRVAPQPQLEIVEVTHQPDEFRTLREGSVVATFANVGDGNAGAMTLQVAVPPRLTFDRATGLSPDGSCSASGDPATGQTVTCQYPQGLPPSATGYSGSARLHFDVGARAGTTLPFVFAVGDALQPGPTLAECAAEPDLVGCATHVVPVAPWIFCDGFEDLAHECGQPQRFD